MPSRFSCTGCFEGGELGRCKQPTQLPGRGPQRYQPWRTRLRGRWQFLLLCGARTDRDQPARNGASQRQTHVRIRKTGRRQKRPTCRVLGQLRVAQLRFELSISKVAEAFWLVFSEETATSIRVSSIFLIDIEVMVSSNAFECTCELVHTLFNAKDSRKW